VTSLFDPLKAGDLHLPNRIVMAPLTRNRAPRAVPTPLMAEYYSQRASAGLLITEATAISAQGQGYADVPGLYGTDQLDGWRRVTDAVHAKRGRIVVQLWHVGRVSHVDLQPGGQKPVAPSAITARTKTYLIKNGEGGFAPTSEPRELFASELPGIVQDYRHAARQAVKTAGFDGVEIHGANGYLLDQFTRDGANKRADAYGGSVENRVRLPLDVLDAVVGVWGPGRVGYRISPNSPFNSMSDSDPRKTFSHLVEQISQRGIGYLHVVDPAADGAKRLSPVLRKIFDGTYIVNGGFDIAAANAAIGKGETDLVAFGVPFLANPDLPERFKRGAALNAPDQATFYAGDSNGYIDYPALA
jgi:N-ethylmaleimide reductase